MKHITYMQAAIEEAKKAQNLGEVPIGAVIVKMEKSSLEVITCEKQVNFQMPMLK